MELTARRRTPNAGGGVAEPRADAIVQAWERLADKRIYFGHQSVGANVLDGVRSLRIAEPWSLPVVSTRELDRESGPGLFEFCIGQNGNARSKSADFATFLGRAPRHAKAIALFKYCYLDITPTTDIKALFAAHRDAVRTLQTRHSTFTFVHVTAPLTTVESVPRLLTKRLLARPTARDANRKRNEFNVMLRREFQGEPIFDLANIESMRSNGTRSSFRTGEETIHTLAPEFTDDGGHLNAVGRKAAAMELLMVLAEAGG